MLGIDRIPELYIGRDLKVPARAFTIRGGRSAVVLDARLVDKSWTDGLDWLTFVMARALGAIRLGHTQWWVELFTVYARRIPGVRTPLLVKWTLSRDRCGAFVVPDGIRGLLVEAVGNHALTSVDVPAFVTQTERAPRALGSRRQHPSPATVARHARPRPLRRGLLRPRTRSTAAQLPSPEHVINPCFSSGPPAPGRTRRPGSGRRAGIRGRR